MEKNKDKWELESKEKVWNDKKKTCINPASQKDYIGLTVREVFLNLRDEVQPTPIFRHAYKKVRNCITQYEKGKLKSEANNKPGGKRILGGRRKVACADFRKELFAFY